ncbi:LLM class flavin-dependent oxidoreductase [Frankia gtarii]|uniref:LLM class flavin-dependent oxidoreductase n=1 Tax=Frankia gtarii TaxID=2950102 RepID=UPI0021BF983A|nr:LLM class flavin-dependent oxidoreductase [Frankia gtarii]
MRFGVSLVASGQREGATQASMIRERVEMVRVARDAGYHIVSAGQHYAPLDGMLPQPMPLLARLAGEAPGMVFQTGVLLGPFYNPVTFAEEAATLAAITGDNFRAAIGLGYRDAEFAMFGQRPTDRLKRVIELIGTSRRLLRGETVSTEGGFYPLNAVALAPGTVGEIPVPIMIGTGAVKGAARAGRIADGLYVTGYLPPSDVEQLVTTYLDNAQRAGTTEPIVSIRREVTVADSRKAALARSGPGWIRTLSSYLSLGFEQPSLARIVRSLEETGDAVDLPFIVGSPQECAEQIDLYQKLGVRDIVIRFDLNEATHAATLHAIEQFAADVMPLVPADTGR